MSSDKWGPVSDKPIVHVMIPTRELVHSGLALFLVWLATREKRYQVKMGVVEAQPVANTRNRIVWNFLEDETAAYLLMIDSDTVPAGFNPLDYVERGLDVVGWPCPTFRANSDPPLRWYPAPPSDVGLMEVDAVCGAGVLIARRVLEDPAMRGPFLDEWGSDGMRTESEDITFCLRAREAGYKVWCAMDRPLRHYRPAELMTVWEYMEGKND